MENYRTKLIKFIRLKEKLENNTSFNDNPDELDDFNSLKKYFHDLYNAISIQKGKVPGNEYDFNIWLLNEYNHIINIEGLVTNSNSSDLKENELKFYMLSFDNLGFNNEKVYNWHKKILETMMMLNIKLPYPIYKEFYNNNKNLLEYIVQQEDLYHTLNNKGLLNTGICPVTGEKLSFERYNYNLNGRKIYLSKKGIGVCETIKREELKELGMNYDLLKKIKKRSLFDYRLEQFIFILTIIIGLYLSWIIILPNSILLFLAFLIVAYIFHIILLFIIIFIVERLL